MSLAVVVVVVGFDCHMKEQSVYVKVLVLPLEMGLQPYAAEIMRNLYHPAQALEAHHHQKRNHSLVVNPTL